jgi:hypothetical protein
MFIGATANNNFTVFLEALEEAVSFLPLVERIL